MAVKLDLFTYCTQIKIILLAFQSFQRSCAFSCKYVMPRFIELDGQVSSRRIRHGCSKRSVCFI